MRSLLIFSPAASYPFDGSIFSLKASLWAPSWSNTAISSFVNDFANDEGSFPKWLSWSWNLVSFARRTFRVAVQADVISPVCALCSCSLTTLERVLDKDCNPADGHRSLVFQEGMCVGEVSFQWLILWHDAIVYSTLYQLFTKSILPVFKLLLEQHLPAACLAGRGFAEWEAVIAVFRPDPHKLPTCACLCVVLLRPECRWQRSPGERYPGPQGCPDESPNLSALHGYLSYGWNSIAFSYWMFGSVYYRDFIYPR